MTTPKKGRDAREIEVPAAEFKTKCLSLMEDVYRRKRSFVVTKRGKRVAQLVPIPDEGEHAFIGSLRGCVLRADALTEPTGESWDAESR